jgi:hypothetical protein
LFIREFVAPAQYDCAWMIHATEKVRIFGCCLAWRSLLQNMCGLIEKIVKIECPVSV